MKEAPSCCPLKVLNRFSVRCTFCRFKWQEDVLRVYQPEVQEGERLIVIIAVNAAERQREVGNSLVMLAVLDSLGESQQRQSPLALPMGPPQRRRSSTQV